MSAENKRQLAEFIGTSVLPGTQRTYENHWELWRHFMLTDRHGFDPYLRDVSEDEKAGWIGLFIHRRYMLGNRGKAATAVTAGIRMRFAENLQNTTFLSSAVIATVRKACKLNPDELRVKRNAGISESVKLPVSQDVLGTMRTRLWCRVGWGARDLASRMRYIGAMWAFDQAARVSEYTKAEPGAQDHCVRVDDLTFIMRLGESVVGSQLVALLAGSLTDRAPMIENIVECRVLAASSKGKVVVKPKLISRMSTDESQFIDDLVEFMTRSGALGEDELFSYRNVSGKKIVLRSRTIREDLKEECKAHGLPPNFFSSHSYRKGAVSHMRAAGASEDDRRDRSGHAPGSEVMNTTYDHVMGIGPLAANSLPGARRPGVADVKKLIPARRTRSASAAIASVRKPLRTFQGSKKRGGAAAVAVTGPLV
jgi:hypothetical protein